MYLIVLIFQARSRVDSKGDVELPLGGAIKVNGMTAAKPVQP